MNRTTAPLLLVALAACRSNSPAVQQAAADAGTDGGGYPVAVNALDIAVTGCASSRVDAGAESCSGPVPFTVTFSPVGAPGLTSFVWDFGDGSPPSSEVAPVHTYAIPGRYGVSVKGGSPSTGTIPAARPGLIAALAIGTGGPCDVTAQCGVDGLECLCKPGDGCGPAFTRGICSTKCPGGFCGMGAVCAVYLLPPGAPGDGADAGSPWGAICLADCGNGNSCAPGFVCQSFHAGAGSGNSGWVRGCLPTGAAGDIGSSCRTAGGALDDTRCATGTCSPAASNGFCSSSCQAPLTCPAGTACARLPAGQICVPACAPNQPCSGDPSVACQNATAADAGVDGGFPIVTGDFTQTYCVPSSL